MCEQLFLALAGKQEAEAVALVLFALFCVWKTVSTKMRKHSSKKVLLKQDSGKPCTEELRILVMSLGFPDAAAHPVSSLQSTISTL